MSRLPWFSGREWAVIVAVGIVTPLIDSRLEVILVQFFEGVRGSLSIFDFTGGPLNSDALVAWEEYGAVLAAFVVRRRGAATAAMTINGFGQYVVDGFQGPHHLLYGVAGLGADVVFALFRYRRFDALVCAASGAACQAFWIPVTYVYHDVFARFGGAFIAGDVATRLVVGAVADGLGGALLGLVALTVLRGRINQKGLTSNDAVALDRGTSVELSSAGWQPKG
ncbi:MAG TPA: ECF transporter S component [Nitrososphaerales archaeon]|nr:ECF transporter S component [Nitrososphaerales archaeon]